MSLNVNGKSCPVCHAYLFEEDDVVYCPVCGAPHHRECYNRLGHCGLEQFHGTENEYSNRANETAQAPVNEKDETDMPVICPRCLKEIEKDSQVCPYCGMPQNGRVVNFVQMDAFGGVPENADLGDGVTAEEAARFVAINTQRYLPRFERAENGKKTSWNWLAFLLPEGWFFLRKMYKQGILALTVLLAGEILSFPLLNMANGIVANNYGEMAKFILEKVMNGNYWPMILSFLSLVIVLGLKIVCGLFGDNIYRNHVVEQAKAARQADDSDTYIAKHGGLSFWLFLGGILISNYLPNILIGLFM